MRVNLRWLVVPLLAAAVIAADQWTKGLVEKNIPLWGSYTPFPELERYLSIVHYTKTGAAFGLFQGAGAVFVLIAVVVIVAVLVYSRYLPADNWGIRLCMGLQLGGAAGNLIDRLQHNWRVTDFLRLTLPVGDRVYEWPAFNVADSSIVVGTILMGILLLRLEGKKDASRTPAT